MPAPLAPKSTGDLPRKRLVPKKSKFGLLGSSSTKGEREQDFSDVTRRVGVSVQNEVGFEIYVDPAEDPDIGDILLVKKKKSRAALDGMTWGTLGEVTNIPSITKPKENKEKSGKKEEGLLKVKVDENQKWWSIGRGRKDSKEKEEPAKSPDPVAKPADTRTRFNSLDSGILLSSPICAEHPRSPVEYLRVPTPTATLAPPGAGALGSGKDSVAMRAMRSVRSLARIGSWAQLKGPPSTEDADKDKDKEQPDAKKKKKKKEKAKVKETARYSGSSFEAGALSASPAASKTGSRSLGKKTSILGLGLPSTMRLPTSRSGSTASSIVTSNGVGTRLSVDSANILGGGILARGRSGSTMSTASSLRPRSTASGASSNSSVSVRWDEAGLETVKESRRKERESKKVTKEKDKKSKRSKNEKDSNRKVSDRTLSEHDEEDVSPNPVLPVLTVEEATIEECSADEVTLSNETPMKRTRLRPMSEQLLSRSRPKAIYDDGDDNAVISLLDAATNDLAQLINRLDLEATPGSRDISPRSNRSPSLLDQPGSPTPSKNRFTMDSPVRALRPNVASITSLRPYDKTSTVGQVQIGQNIAPWATLNASISPSKPSPATIRAQPKEDPTHHPILKALRPAVSKVPRATATVRSSAAVPPFVLGVKGNRSLSFSFHVWLSAFRSLIRMAVHYRLLYSGKAKVTARKRSSLVPIQDQSGSLPIPPEARRNLGLTGTMGGSVGSMAEQEFDASDPDSDIPDELQVILSNSDQELDDTMSFNPNMPHPPLPSPGLPPGDSAPCSECRVSMIAKRISRRPEPYPRLRRTPRNQFDFTGEINKLNESGASHRRSFVEQLESAFRTPAKIDLRSDFGNFLNGDVPPVPTNSLQDELSRAGQSTFSLPDDYESRELLPSDFPVDVNAEPSLLPGTDSYATTVSDDDLWDMIAPQMLRKPSSMGSRPSDGELNRDFKFGGIPSPAAAEDHSQEDALLTLSDIIPPPAVAHSLSTGTLAADESSLLKSIFAKASDSSSNRGARAVVRNSTGNGHQRNSSALSFGGLDSFAEVRRGFEFHDDRPGFYPGASITSKHGKHESIFSIASVSSYGRVLHPGSADPFDYGLLAANANPDRRRYSDDFSFSLSTTVDDTFSFIHKDPRRKRVDSDASSFYFRAPAHMQLHQHNHSHRRHESSASVTSLGPPISLYNRSLGHHRRGDSSTSISSVAQSYALCGASGGRAAWAKHRPDFSVDSVLSNYSGARLGRPGLGDKMLESAFDHGMPLTSISASPPESLAGSVRSERITSEEYEPRASYDSIMDSRNALQKTTAEDSLFEKTGYRTSVSSSDSMFFGKDPMDARHADLPRYRPISSFSVSSKHSPAKEDDTMISMLGGGHVRRLSVGSMIEASPCVRKERRKQLSNDLVPEPVFKLAKGDYETPDKSRVIESKPSIASTINSFKFGDERMIRAKHGLLERQSLENTVLVADGEDTSGSFRMQPVFTRQPIATRSRSSTCTSSSGAETPPLSICDGYSSLSEGSQSSIDLGQLNFMLANATHPPASTAFDRVRSRARGHGHRRRISQARASRTSVYETIEEEMTTSLSPFSSPDRSAPGSATKTVQLPESVTKTMGPSRVFVVDPETSSVDSISPWDDEKGITALRKYYALRDEAQDAVTESKRIWVDTPFSVFAVQSFDPPRHRSGMQALLEHSIQNYHPLPSELGPRRMRSRADSRPSPYPRTIMTSHAPSPAAEQLRAPVVHSITNAVAPDVAPDQPKCHALQEVPIDLNVNPSPEHLEKLPDEKAVTLTGKLELVFGLPSRPRVASNARRAALGWSKRGTGRIGAENKENSTSLGNISLGAGLANISQGIIMTCAIGDPSIESAPTPRAPNAGIDEAHPCLTREPTSAMV
ncbi:hypothetical protein F5141DRAFT_1230782 [Pisolithus sp. B1]|nr:hypothetical protein F5141DRAFT_1230782 [Pisolithus sp. B1]